MILTSKVDKYIYTYICTETFLIGGISFELPTRGGNALYGKRMLMKNCLCYFTNEIGILSFLTE